MPKPPYLNFPFQFYKNHYRNSYQLPYYSPQEISVTSTFSTSHNTLPNNKEEKNKSNKNSDNFLFDLFGLKIYSDDVLLISLIYFLYSEGVKDDGLFITLILLLLS